MTVQPLRLDEFAPEVGDDAENLLVVLVFAERFSVSLEERNVVLVGELFAEFIDINGLVVDAVVVVIELCSRNEGNDRIVVVKRDARSVHPRLVLVDERECVARVIDELADYRRIEYQIGLEEERVVLCELFFGERERIDIVRLVIDRVVDIGYRGLDPESLYVVRKFASLVTGNDYDSRKLQVFDLMKHAVNERNAVDLNHALGVVACQILEPLSHTRGKYNRLHKSFLLRSRFLSG